MAEPTPPQRRKRIPTLAKAASVKAPALIIIGEVVKLRRKLEWFTPHSDEAKQVAVWNG